MRGAKPQPMRAEPPPLLDKVVRFLVWSGVIGSLAAPIILMVMLWNSLSFTPAGMRPPKFEEVHRLIFDAHSWAGGIGSGPNSRALLKDANRLREMTAYSGEATTVARSIELIVVRFADGVPPPASTDAQPQRAGYRTIGLDITALQRTGVLIMADAPILWNVAASAPGQRARLAFEGAAPFDVANGHPGLLAGFRIASFGGGDTAQVSDTLSTESGNVRRYCAALAQWAQHFGLRVADISATFLENPTSIRISDRGVVHDGREMAGRSPFSSCNLSKAR